jgi:hypothetical protein
LKPRVLIGSSVRAIRIAECAQRDLAHYSEPELWHNNKFLSRDTPIESLFQMLDEFQFALFVALPEDITSKGGTEYLTVRDNVLFEMGLFLGRLGRERVFLIAPRGSGDAKPQQLPSDLTGIQPSYYDAHAVNLQSAVATSLFELKEALRAFDAKFLIFDARHNLRSEQLVNKGGKRHDPLGNPVSDVGTASFKLTNEALEIKRTNDEGVWQIEIRPNGRLTPTVAKRPGLDRTLRVEFEAKITGTEHIVRCVSVNASNWAWIDSRDFSVTEGEWRSFRAELSAPPNFDVLVRLQDELQHPPDGILYLRNIAVRLLDPRREALAALQHKRGQF